jgi:hypothetical protein
LTQRDTESKRVLQVASIKIKGEEKVSGVFFPSKQATSTVAGAISTTSTYSIKGRRGCLGGPDGLLQHDPGSAPVQHRIVLRTA